MAVMEEWFKANYPKTTVVIKRSAGGMSSVDKNPVGGDRLKKPMP